MSSFRVLAVPLTGMGSLVPAPREHSGGYRYHHRPGWPYDPASHDPDPHLPAGASKSKDDKAKRMIVFTAARETEGLSVKAAGRKAGIAYRTAGRYEEERLGRQQQSRDEGPSPREIVAALHAEIAAMSPEHAALVAVFEQIPRPGPWGHRSADISVVRAVWRYERTWECPEAARD